MAEQRRLTAKSQQLVHGPQRKLRLHWPIVLAALLLLVAATVVSIDIVDAGSVAAYWRSRNWPKSAEAIAHTAQALALAIAGVWTYQLFIKQRYDHARANIIHSLAIVAETPAYFYVRVSINVQNIGNVRVIPPWGLTQVFQAQPVPEAVVAATPLPATRQDNDPNLLPWPEISCVRYALGYDGLILDPSESESVFCDFTVPKHVVAIFVKTKINSANPDDPEDSWRATSFHVLASQTA